MRIKGDYFADQVSSDDGLHDVNVIYNEKFIGNTKYEFPEVTKSMIDSIINNINIHTANGPDNTSNKFIKETKEVLLTHLQYIFNFSLIHGVYLKQWKISNWTPLHKRASIYKRENYRPISLCNNLGKISDKIIFHTFYNYLEEK